jgi:hypothetical protein
MDPETEICVTCGATKALVAVAFDLFFRLHFALLGLGERFAAVSGDVETDIILP